MEDDLGAADEREPHAEPEDAARVGDELRLGGLDLAQVASGVRVLQKRSTRQLQVRSPY